MMTMAESIRHQRQWLRGSDKSTRQSHTRWQLSGRFAQGMRGITIHIDIPFSFGSGLFFFAKLLCPETTSSDAALAVGVLAGSLPYFFSFLEKIGIPASPSDCTLALCSLTDTDFTCKKNSSPDQEAHRASTKGKRIETQNLKF